MPDLSLYEKKIINDEEYPVQMFMNHIQKTGVYFPPHWHEHIEMHYVLKGKGVFYCNQKPLYVEEGSLAIFNSNELHEGINNSKNLEALVIIFVMEAFSKEIADFNVVFQSLVPYDVRINELITAIYQEETDKKFGYKLEMKGKIYELITYLLRNYVVQFQSAKESIRRKQNLNRLNIVLQYIQDNYPEPVTNRELADLIHLSEYRFCHIFRESIGKSPLNYIHEVRLKKAYYLLEQKEMSISEISAAVGFQDYNDFGRLFRKYYGFAPSHVWNM